MNLADLTLRVRRQLPQAGGLGDTADATIWFELNHGVDEVNLIVKGWKAYNNVANIPALVGTPQVYSLSQICPGFLTMEKSGVIWFDTSGVSRYIYPRTLRWLDLNIRNWRDQAPSATIPSWYWHDCDQLGFFPPSTQQSTNATKDFRVHYLVKGAPMTTGTIFPFSGTGSEITALRACDNAIIAYAVAQLAPASFDKEGRNNYEQMFAAEVKKAASQIKRQWDLTSDSDYLYNAGIETGFLPR